MLMFVRPPREGDAEYIAEHMRESDVNEVRAVTEAPLDDVLRTSVGASYMPGAVVDMTGKPYALFGAAPRSPLSRIAEPWLLGIPELADHGVWLTKKTRVYLQQVERVYPVLENFVDARNTASVAWLRAVGFTLDDPQPFGYRDILFHRFYKGA